MGPKILIVEDEIVLAKDLSRSLKSAGYEVTARVSSGEEAIRVVEELEPDLVLMDINLRGEKDGIEAAESIRNRYDVPVVYLTGFAEEDVLERAKRTEPYGYLSKPFSLIELKSTIETTLYKHEAIRRVRASEHQLRLVTDSLGALLAHVNAELRYLWANRAYGEFFGLSPSKIKGRHVRDVLGDKTYSSIRHYMERALSGEKVSFETSTSGESGELKHFAATYVPHVRPDGTVHGFIVHALDITDRKKAEEALNQLNRELRAMSTCNQVLVRAEEEPALLNDICRIVCDTAGYRMAWVGYAETDEGKTIRPVACAGAEDGVLEQAGLTWDDTEHGRGPTGTAIRTGKSTCIQDFTIDSQVAPWWEDAVRRGYRSCIALPLKDENESTFGILCIYSSEPNAFTPDEIRFLEELSANLAFGITVLRGRIELRRVEGALRESEKKVRRRLDAMLSPEIDIEALELSDIIDSERIQKLMDEFYRLTNVGIGIIDLHGKVLVGTGWQDICTKFHRVNPESCRLCIESDIELSRNVPVGTFKQYRCKHNMWDIATPIMLEDKHVGNIFLGQFLFDDEVPEYELFRQQARKYGFQEEEYIAALDRVPRWSHQKVDAAMSFYAAFASMIGNLSYSNIKLANVLEGRKRAEEALKEREEFLYSIVENIPDMIFIKDAQELRFVRFNKAGEKLLGFKREDLIGKNDYDFFPKEQADFFTKKDREVLESGHVYDIPEEPIDTGAGTRILHTKKIPILDKRGKPAYLLGISEDITERKKAEEALRQSEALLRTTFENASIGVCLVGTDGRFLRVNRTMCELLGYTDNELCQMAFNDITHDDDRDIGTTFVNRALSGEVVTTSFEKRYIHKSGEVVWAQVSSTVLRTPTGEPQYFITHVQDITERKQAEERLRLLEFALDHVHEAAFLIDENSRLRFVNEESCRKLGYTRSELLGLGVSDVDPDSPIERWPSHWNDLKAEGSLLFESRHKAKDGRILPVEISANYFEYGDQGYNLALVRDISERKQAERELQRTNDLLRAIIEAAPTAIIGLDLDGNVRDVWNPAAEKLLGWSAHEVMGRLLPSVSVEKQEEFRGFRERIRSGKTLDGVEVSRLKRDGTPIDYSIYASPLHDAEGRITGNIAVLVDITERKKSERILKARLTLSDYAYTHTLDELLQKTLDIAESLTDSQIGFFHFLEADQKTLSLQMWSTNTLDKMCTAEGKGSHYPVEQAGVWVDCIFQRAPVIHNDYEALPHRKGIPPGHARVTRELVVPVFQGDAIVAIVGVGNKPSEYGDADVEVMSKLAEMAWDIVVRKMTEESLRRRDEYLTNIMESLTHPFYIVNTDDYTVQMSNRAAFASGVPEGTTCYSATHGRTVPCGGADRPCPMEILKSTGQPTMVEHVHHDEDGRLRNIEVYAYPISDSEGRVKQIIEYCLDVTDRTHAQQALLESERTLKTILSLSPSGIGYFRDGQLTWANRAMMDLFGYREDEQEDFFGTSPPWFYESEEEYARVRALLWPDRDEGRPAEVEARFRRKDGSIFIGSMAVSAPVFDHGEMGTTVVISDITTRKAAEEERARLVTVIEQSAESIVVTDREATIQYVNPAFEKLTGYTAREAEGQNPRVLKSGIHDAEFYRKMWDTLTSGESWRGHLVNKKKDGSLFEEEATISPVKDESGVIVNYVAVKRDVTDRVLLEKRLQQAQKMEAIGTLAAGIAHDFNNLLFVITGNTELALDVEPRGSELHGYLEEALKAAHRATDLVRQILAFSRQRTTERTPISITPVVKEVVKFLRASIPATIEIELHVGEDPGTIGADPTEIHQVLMNLCSNAAHSMRTRGGLLEVGLARVEVDHEFAALHDNIETGRYAKLTVSDTGHGISPEDLERVFEPYFTTKQRGEGTGLGLAVVHGIVRSYGGTVSVYSEPGKGSTFCVYLPVQRETAPTPEETVPHVLPTGRETILVVDDEPSVTRIVNGILKSLGYQVVPVNDPREALNLFAARPDEFDLIITDMTMPKMTGTDLAKELMSIRPDIPVILCTGFSELVSKEHAEKLGFQSFLMKPIRKTDLAQTVHSVLHGGKKSHA